MKTTDSVMREEIIEFFSHHPTRQSAKNFLTRRLSQAEARGRENERERVVGLLEDAKTGQNVIINLVSRDKVTEANIENRINNKLSDLLTKINDSNLNKKGDI